MRHADTHCKYIETYTDIPLDGHYYHFNGDCVICGQPQKVTVKGRELFKYRQGELMQNALKSNTDEEREFLMSGICSQCWDQMAQEMEDED